MRGDPSWEQDLLWTHKEQVRGCGAPPGEAEEGQHLLEWNLGGELAREGGGGGTWVCSPGVLKLSR